VIDNTTHVRHNIHTVKQQIATTCVCT